MEKGTAGSSGGSVDRRRTTVSGPLPQLDIDEQDVEDGRVRSFDEAMKLPWSSQPTPSSSIHPSKPAGRKRSVSGGIFSRLNFMKSAGDDGKLQPRDDQDQATPGVKIPKSPKNLKTRKSIDDGNEPTTSPASPVEEENAMAAAMKPVKTRKRKGSLRKTALLGTRRIVTEGRERKNSLLQRSPSSKQPQPQPPAPQQYIPRPIPTQAPKGELSQTSFSDTNESNTSLRTKFSYENIRASYSSDSGWSRPAAPAIGRLSLLTEQTGQENDQDSVTELASSMDPLSANSQTSYTSTTDDDDVLTFDRPANSFVGAPRDGTALKKPLSSAATGYFPLVASASQESLTRRLSSKKSRSSPLSHNITTLSSFPESEPHDYTETEYWGWVILFITWLTFTVGMGSCLEIWSWAWDVGETPYAPPELENDDTLPIVGYYPAMIVLTGVVAWVWITVAWVGMKYFRHAKIEV